MAYIYIYIYIYQVSLVCTLRRYIGWWSSTVNNTLVGALLLYLMLCSVMQCVSYQPGIYTGKKRPQIYIIRSACIYVNNNSFDFFFFRSNLP